MNTIEKITREQISSIQFESSEHGCFSYEFYSFKMFFVGEQCMVHLKQEPRIKNQIPSDLEFPIKPYVFDFILNKSIRLVNKSDVNPSACGGSTTKREFFIEIEKNDGECVTIEGETRSPFTDLCQMEKEFKNSNLNIKRELDKLRRMGGFYISDSATISFIEQTHRHLKRIYLSK